MVSVYLLRTKIWHVPVVPSLNDISEMLYVKILKNFIFDHKYCQKFQDGRHYLAVFEL